MQAQDIPQEGDTQHSIITMLVIDDGGLWSEDEIGREIEGGAAVVEDALARLFAMGMIHRPVAGFVVASRAAKYAYALDRA